MGDHVPAFLMRELRIETEADAPEEPETLAVETPAIEAAAEPAPQELPRPRRRTRSRAATAAEAPATDAA